MQAAGTLQKLQRKKQIQNQNQEEQSIMTTTDTANVLHAAIRTMTDTVMSADIPTSIRDGLESNTERVSLRLFLPFSFPFHVFIVELFILDFQIFEKFLSFGLVEFCDYFFDCKNGSYLDSL